MATYLTKTTSWHLLAGAFAAGFALTPLPAAAGPRPVLSADQCQPLTNDNYELCCIAQNRNRLLSEGDIANCPPLTTSLIDSVLERQDSARDRETTTGSVSRSSTAGAGSSGSTGAGASGTGGSTAGGAGTGATGGNDTGGSTGGKTGEKDNKGLGNGGEGDEGTPKGSDPDNPGKGSDKSQSGDKGKGNK